MRKVLSIIILILCVMCAEVVPGVNAQDEPTFTQTSILKSRNLVERGSRGFTEIVQRNYREENILADKTAVIGQKVIDAGKVLRLSRTVYFTGLAIGSGGLILSAGDPEAGLYVAGVGGGAALLAPVGIGGAGPKLEEVSKDLHIGDAGKYLITYKDYCNGGLGLCVGGIALAMVGESIMDNPDLVYIGVLGIPIGFGIYWIVAPWQIRLAGTELRKVDKKVIPLYGQSVWEKIRAAGRDLEASVRYRYEGVFLNAFGIYLSIKGEEENSPGMAFAGGVSSFAGAILTALSSYKAGAAGGKLKKAGEELLLRARTQQQKGIHGNLDSLQAPSAQSSLSIPILSISF